MSVLRIARLLPCCDAKGKRAAWPRIRPLALGRSASASLAHLLDPRPGLLIGIYLLLTLLVTQQPFTYRFTIGRTVGPDSDRPFLVGFYEFETTPGSPQSGGGKRYRWSRARESVIEVPGTGRRGVAVQLEIIAHHGQWDPAAPPTVVQFHAGDHVVIPITLRQAAAHYTLYLPPHALEDGRLRLAPITALWRAPGERRKELGLALAQTVTVAGMPTAGVVLPDRPLVVGWSVGLALFWLAVRVMGFTARAALRMLLPLAVSVPLAMLIDAPRVGFTGGWIIRIAALSLLLAVAGVRLLPGLLVRFSGQERRAIPHPPAIVRWLLLLLVLSFALKYGGRLYPESMPGDLQLHINRYHGAVQGQLYIQAGHRGLAFPFPPGLYLLLAPLTLPGVSIRSLFPIMAGIFETSAVLLIYLLVVRAGGSARLGLVAAAIYALTAAGFMTTWFSFQTHVSTQWFGSVLMLVLVARWPHWYDRPTVALLALLLAQVFLGHIGQFINTVLLGLLVVPLLWWRARRSAEGRASLGWLIAAALVAGSLAALFYYGAFMELITRQITGAATSGLNVVTGRKPIPRATTLQVLWQGGLITHFGFFPVLLAVPGALRLATGRLRRSLLPLLIWTTFAVSASQAVLPLITLSSITTRWLTFAAWAIAVSGGSGLLLLWRRGRSARLVVLAMALYVCWITTVIYVQALVLRQPPIEPF